MVGHLRQRARQTPLVARFDDRVRRPVAPPPTQGRSRLDCDRASIAHSAVARCAPNAGSSANSSARSLQPIPSRSSERRRNIGAGAAGNALRRRRRRLGSERPFECRAHVIEIARRAARANPVPAPYPIPRTHGRRSPQTSRACRLKTSRRLAGFVEPFARIFANRLEQAVAHRPVRAPRPRPTTCRPATSGDRACRPNLAVTRVTTAAASSVNPPAKTDTSRKRLPLFAASANRSSSRSARASSAGAACRSRGPPVSTRSRSRRESSSSETARMRAAASSIASAMPSRRRQRSSTAARLAASTRNAGLTAGRAPQKAYSAAGVVERRKPMHAARRRR